MHVESHRADDDEPTDFKDCLRVAYSGRVAGRMSVDGQAMKIREGSVTQTDWYARGVGLVKRQRTETMTGRNKSGRSVSVTETETWFLRPKSSR